MTDSTHVRIPNRWIVQEDQSDSDPQLHSHLHSEPFPFLWLLQNHREDHPSASLSIWKQAEWYYGPKSRWLNTREDGREELMEVRSSSLYLSISNFECLPLSSQTKAAVSSKLLNAGL